MPGAPVCLGDCMLQNARILSVPGSYYTDIERTIYLTYFILKEDIAKYDDLFQQERKFIRCASLLYRTCTDSLTVQLRVLHNVCATRGLRRAGVRQPRAIDAGVKELIFECMIVSVVSLCSSPFVLISLSTSLAVCVCVCRLCFAPAIQCRQRLDVS